jgi:hypothetical protein
MGRGDSTEGRIAGALIDISDADNEAPWDRYTEGTGNVWSTFTRHVSGTLAQFWAQRAADGFNTTDAGASADLFQNTVDYTFRDPLGNYLTLGRPTPVPSHAFSFNTTTSYWSVTAVRPPAGADYDLTLFDDRALSQPLGASLSAGSSVDFVAVDTNRRPAGDYFPRVNRFSGTGAYQMELAQGSATLTTTPQSVTMGAQEVVAVRDVYLAAGQSVTLRVATSNPGQDPELLLMGSDQATAATWVRPRAAAAASSVLAGPGATEQIVYTAPTTGWYGLVLVKTRLGPGPTP